MGCKNIFGAPRRRRLVYQQRPFRGKKSPTPSTYKKKNIKEILSVQNNMINKANYMRWVPGGSEGEFSQRFYAQALT